MTQTCEQVTAAFKAELQALLAKYDAELEAEDHYSGYPECGEDVRMTVTVPSVYDDQGNHLREWTNIDLGRTISGRKPIDHTGLTARSGHDASPTISKD